MNTPIVIDACTLINLLRIDEEDELLYKCLKKQNVHIASTVFKEIKDNIYKNHIDEIQKKRIEKILYTLKSVFEYHEDDTIINDIGDAYFESIMHYTKHEKKLNGELISTVLALVLSRTEESKVSFFTDDFPAKKEFELFFSIQQIGRIEDSVDLLMQFHWSIGSFSQKKLKDKLFDLRAEYNNALREFMNQVKRVKLLYKQKDNTRKMLEDLEYAFQHKDLICFENYFNLLKNKNDNEIKKMVEKFPYLSHSSELINKITNVLQELNKINIYRIC